MDDPYDVAVQGGERVGMPTGKKRLREALVQRFPGDVVAIDRYFEEVAKQQVRHNNYYNCIFTPRSRRPSLPRCCLYINACMHTTDVYGGNAGCRTWILRR